MNWYMQAVDDDVILKAINEFKRGSEVFDCLLKCEGR